VDFKDPFETHCWILRTVLKSLLNAKTLLKSRFQVGSGGGVTDLAGNEMGDSLTLSRVYDVTAPTGEVDSTADANYYGTSKGARPPPCRPPPSLCQQRVDAGCLPKSHSLTTFSALTPHCTFPTHGQLFAAQGSSTTVSRS
jgi:hypothetical protein